MPAVDIAVIGAGAAGIAAGRALAAANASFRILEARGRLGGRAWTSTRQDWPLDLGCFWLHSADRNPWTAIAAAAGFTVDRTTPPWGTQWRGHGYSRAEQRAFRAEQARFYDRLEALPEHAADLPAAALLQPGNRWNGLLDALSTYINGAELAEVSARDWQRYADTEVNWRVREGYGTAIAQHGAGLPVTLDCPVSRIDHGGATLRLATPRGELTARAVIVTVPSNLLADGTLAFSPALPDKRDAAAALPLGLADKLVLRLDAPALLPADGHLFARVDRTAIGSYHLRPFGRPLVEGYFGGRLARELEQGGPDAFAGFAIDELVNLLGGDIRRHLSPLAATAWAADPYARGSYSHARPGRAEARAALAQPVDDRLFFAGEACSTHSFSTAHGAHETGVRAAAAALGRELAPGRAR